MLKKIKSKISFFLRPLLLIIDFVLSKDYLMALRDNPFYKNKYYPYLTVSFINFLETIDLKNSSILEFGGGYGSIYFAKKCKEITIIENKKIWKDFIIQKLKNDRVTNFEILEKQQFNFNKKYDLIIIDAFDRISLLKESLNYLNQGGFIIFDNSDRYFPEIYGTGYTVINFWGYIFQKKKKICTSLITKDFSIPNLNNKTI